jgi:hypothetical protein
MYDVFGLARLAFIQCIGDRVALRLVASVADMASVGIAYAMLGCAECWAGTNPFEFASRGDPHGWANLVGTTHGEHAEHQGLPTCDVGRFMLWFADNVVISTNEFGPELWDQTDADTRSVLVLDQFAIGQALVERAGRPLITYSARGIDGRAGRSGSEAGLGKAGGGTANDRKVSRPATREPVS